MATTYKNYSISSSKGKLYLKEKAPKEGYEEIIYGTNGEKKTYHKYEDSIQGKPKEFNTKEVDFEGRKLRFLEFSLEDGDTINKISVPLKNKSGYTNEVKAIVSALNDLKTDEVVTFTPKVTTYTPANGGKPKENLNIYVNYVNILGDNGKGLSTGFIPFSEIPRAEKEVDEDDGEVTWNWKPVNKFFTTKIKEISDKFPVAPTPEAPKEETKPVATQAKTASAPETEEEDNSDELPF